MVLRNSGLWTGNVSSQNLDKNHAFAPFSEMCSSIFRNEKPQNAQTGSLYFGFWSCRALFCLKLFRILESILYIARNKAQIKGGIFGGVDLGGMWIW
jgi:hypothetical protein